MLIVSFISTPMKRIIFSILITIIAYTTQSFICAGFCAGQQPAAESKGSVLGKWAFDGKDDKGVVWTGTFTIKELNTTNFDAYKYHLMFTLEVESKDSSYGVNTPCVWDMVKRKVSFSSGIIAHSSILSANGKSMMQGKWTESEEGLPNPQSNCNKNRSLVG